MDKASRTACAKRVSKSGQDDDGIRCAMTDEQYHEVINELSAIEGMLELIRAPADADHLGLQIGLRVIGEKLKAANDLMDAAWVRTREARAAG